MALEPRLMFDGAAVATADAATDDGSHKTVAPDPAPVAAPTEHSAPAERKEVAFIDATLADAKTLASSLRAGVEVVFIAQGQDALTVMADWAATHSGYDAVHIFSHGSDGTLILGGTSISSASLDNADTQAKLAALGKALTADGDLLLYGCDVAKDETGQKFITRLAEVTGAEVAASTDATGAARLGGDWTLETSTGTIETASVLAAGTDQAYDHLLATFDFTGASSNAGTVTQTVSGVTVTVSTSEGPGVSILNVTSLDSSSTLGNVATKIAGTSDHPSLESGNLIVSFSTAVTITSLTLVDSYSNDSSLVTPVDIRLTPTGGSNSYVDVHIDDLRMAYSQVAALNWTGVTSFTVSVLSFDGKDCIAVDDIAFSITPTVAAPSTPDMAAGSDTGVATDNITSNTTPVFTGTAEAGASVTLYDTNGTTVLGTGTADGSGNWSITSSTLSAGSHTITAKATVSGVTSSASTGLSVTIDTSTTTPSVPDMTAGSDTGLSTDNITSTTTPVFTGTAEAGASVTLYDTNGTTVIGTGTADGSGNWSITASSALSEGTHTITAKATDIAGNVSTLSSGLQITIDTTVPSAPSTPDLAAGSDTGSSTTDNITSNTTPVFTGTAEAGASVTLYDTNGTTALGTATADGSGNWSITASTLSAGSHTITAKATDIAGNVSVASSGLAVTIDTSAAAPSTPDLAAGSDTGVTTDNITSITTPTFTGTAEANATVRLYDTDGTTVLGTATADGSGNWSITSSTLSAGSHTITAKATDAAGNVSAASSGLVVTIDTTAPSAPVVTGITTDTGTSATDGITNDQSLIINGTAEANSTVEVFKGGVSIGTATTNGSGAWSFDYTGTTLAEGSYTFTAKATDVAGNVSALSSGLTVTIDTTAPAVPAVTGISTDTGVNSTDGITTDTTLVINGTGPASTLIEVFMGGISIGTATSDGTGAWSFDYTGTSLALGSYVFTAKSKDTAGNLSAASSDYTVQVVTGPAAPTGLTISDDTGSSATDGITSDTTLVISGSAPASATVLVFKDGVQIGTTTADGSGVWSFDYTGTTLAPGTYAFTAVSRVSGQDSVASTAKTVTVDTSSSAPSTPSMTAGSNTGSTADTITSNTTPTFTGTAEAGASVTLYDTNGTTVLGTATADGSGNWSITSATLSEGAHTITAKATDTAGNVSVASSGLAVTIDTTAPAVPAVTGISSDNGANTTDGITTDTTLVINGTGPANTSIEVFRGGVSIGTTTSDGTGAWSFDYTGTTLAVGSYLFSAKATDTAGNQSAASSDYTVQVVTGPAAPTGLTISTDSGSSSTDGITNDTTLIISGSAPANATVLVYKDGVQIGSATADGTGAWSFDYTGTTLASGTYAFTAVSRVSGQDSVASTAKTVIVDTNAPTAPAVTGITTDDGDSSSDGITTDRTLVIHGTAEANSTVEVFKDGVSIGTTTANGSGAWSFDHTGTTLAYGTYSFTAKATDAAGNESAASSAFSVRVTTDSTVPAAPTLTVTGGGASTAVTISGTTEANATVNIYDGGSLLGTVTADGTGAWTLSSILSVGTHALTATATDTASNTSVNSSAVSVTINSPVVVLPPSTSEGSKDTTGGESETKDTPTQPQAPQVAVVTMVRETTVSDKPVGLQTVVRTESLTQSVLGTGQTSGGYSSPSALGGGFSSIFGDTRTTSGTGGFQVSVVGRSSGGGDTLTINAPMRDASFALGSRIVVTVPTDAFAHTQADATVTLSARRADGAPLPPWISFNPRTGTFEGTPPPNFRGEVAVRVTARDNGGHEVVQTFKIQVGTGNGSVAPGGGGRTDAGPAGRSSLTDQLRDMSKEGRVAKQAALFGIKNARVA